MSWYEEFGATFFITISASVCALCVAALNAVLKSRCKGCSCCYGCFTCERNFEDDVIEADGQPPLITQPSGVSMAKHI